MKAYRDKSLCERIIETAFCVAVAANILIIYNKLDALERAIQPSAEPQTSQQENTDDEKDIRANP